MDEVFVRFSSQVGWPFGASCCLPMAQQGLEIINQQVLRRDPWLRYAPADLRGRA